MSAICLVSIAAVIAVAIGLGVVAAWCLDVANRLAAEAEGE
mgnify:FL=1